MCGRRGSLGYCDPTPETKRDAAPPRVRPVCIRSLHMAAGAGGGPRKYVIYTAAGSFKPIRHNRGKWTLVSSGCERMCVCVNRGGWAKFFGGALCSGEGHGAAYAQ